MVLALLAFLALRQQVELPVVSHVVSSGIVWLVMVGFLGLALHEEPLHAGLSLLTLIGGFLWLLFSWTQSRMLVGLMDGWQVLLGLAISYLTVSRGLAEPAPPGEVAPLRWPR